MSTFLFFCESFLERINFSTISIHSSLRVTISSYVVFSLLCIVRDFYTSNYHFFIFLIIYAKLSSQHSCVPLFMRTDIHIQQNVLVEELKEKKKQTEDWENWVELTAGEANPQNWNISVCISFLLMLLLIFSFAINLYFNSNL